MAVWLLLIFFLCLHNQLSSIHSVTRIRQYRCFKNVIYEVMIPPFNKFSGNICVGKLWKTIFFRGSNLKPIERPEVLLKNGTRDFQNSPPFKDIYMLLCGNQWKFWTISILFLWNRFSRKRKPSAKNGVLFFGWKHYIENASSPYETAISEANVKGTLMQIWKSLYMFAVI